MSRVGLLFSSFRVCENSRQRHLEPCLPPQGFRSGSAFWSQPEHIGDELTGLTMALPRSERGCAGPIARLRELHADREQAGKGMLHKAEAAEMSYECGESSRKAQ